MVYQSNVQILNNFIEKVYTYFNGRINPINKCLGLIFDPTDNGVANYDMMNGYITVYPFNIITSKDIPTQVVDCIVHELLHAEQCIDLNMLASGKCNIFTIEAAVIQKTRLYLLQNKNMIERDLGVTLNLNTLYTNDKYYKDKTEYESITLKQLYENLLYNFISGYDYKELLNNSKNVYVIINKDYKYLIKYNNHYTPQSCGALNMTLYNEVNKYSKYSYSTTVEYDQNYCYINIDIYNQTIDPITKLKG